MSSHSGQTAVQTAILCLPVEIVIKNSKHDRLLISKILITIIRSIQHTKKVLGPELTQTAELKVEIYDSDASCYCQNNNVRTLYIRILETNKTILQFIIELNLRVAAISATSGGCMRTMTSRFHFQHGFPIRFYGNYYSKMYCF